MKRISGILCGLALLATTSLTAFGEADKAKLDERLNSAQAVLNEIMATPDKGIPRGILAGASCVVVIPSYKKGAFVVGAQYGQGVATCRTPNGWSAPVYVQLAGASVGWQIGGQATDLVLIAMNQNGLQAMLKNKAYSLARMRLHLPVRLAAMLRREPIGSSMLSFLPTRAPRASSRASIWMARCSRRIRMTRELRMARLFRSIRS